MVAECQVLTCRYCIMADLCDKCNVSCVTYRMARKFGGN